MELDPYGEEDWGDENNADIKYLVRDNLYKMLDAYIHETNKYKYIKYKMYLKRKNGNYYHIGKFICDKYGKILNGGFSWVILTNAMKPLYKLKKKNIIFLEKFNDEEVKMIDNSDKVYNGLIYRRLSEIYK